MARFDVHRRPDPALRKATPFLLDVQNDDISGIETRVVLPLRAARLLTLPMRDLNPTLEMDGVAVVLDAAAIGAIPVSELKTPVANVRARSDLIAHALDALFGAY